MNQSDRCLKRLFQTAALAPEELPTEVPFHVQASVLADWRFGQPADEATFVLPLVRRAFVCACAIVLISALFTSLRRDGAPNELVIVDSEIQLSFLQ